MGVVAVPLQYVDGLWGALIIKDPTAQVPVDAVVTLNDWCASQRGVRVCMYSRMGLCRFLSAVCVCVNALGSLRGCRRFRDWV